MQLRQVERIPTVFRPGQEEEGLLQVRSEVEQVQNLADACPADMPQACQSSRIGHGPLAQQTVQFMRQRQKTRYPRYPACR